MSEDLRKADEAYALAVARSAHTGDWGYARQAREALHQARAKEIAE